MWSAASTRGGCVCARPGDARGGFRRASSTTHRPRPVDARAASSAASSKSAPPSWGAPGERRVDIAGDGSIRVSEACVSAECWASTRGLDERVAHDRLSAAVESDVNFVDAGVPPPDVRGDARFARWLRRRGGRREDLVVGGHLSRGAFATNESSLDRSAAGLDFGDGQSSADLNAVLVDPKRAYRNVEDAIDRLMLTTGSDWMDVLHVPWLVTAPETLRGRRNFERIDENLKRIVTDKEEAFTTAMETLRWVPLEEDVDGAADRARTLSATGKKKKALLVPHRAWTSPSSSSSSSSSHEKDARYEEVRSAHRRALCDAVRRGKVRKLCVSFETPWDACGLELGDAAFYDANELNELWSLSSAFSSRAKNGAGAVAGSLGDAVAGVSLSLSSLRDPRLASRGDDYEATLARWCAPGAEGLEGFHSAERLTETVSGGFGVRGVHVPVVAARGVFFPPDASAFDVALASSMVRAASSFGDFTREDVALGLARARGYAACVAMGAVSSASANAAMDDETFAKRLASFSVDGSDDVKMHLDAACLAAVDAARLRHFKGASDAERGRGRGRGRGRDPFEELDEDFT